MAPDTTDRTPRAIAILLALGLGFRVVLAYILPGSGFGVDLNAFGFWANDLAQHGPLGFYSRGFFADYTPGYLYILWALGYLGQLLGGLGDLIKLPAIIADLGLGWLVYSMTLELGGSKRAALVAAGLILFNPVAWFDSVVWGQVDSVGVVFLLLALRELWRDRPERASFFGAVAAITKPQLGIIIPIIGAVLFRRYVWDPYLARRQPATTEAGDQVEQPGLLRQLGDWVDALPAIVRPITSAAVGLVTLVVLSAPFGLSIFGLVGQVAKTAAGYPYLTVNAYNPWGLLQQGGNGLAAAGTWVCDSIVTDASGKVTCATPFLIGPLWAVVVGTALLLLVVGVVCIVIARNPDRRTILIGLAVLAVAFFVVPTRVHERYLYPFFALGAILAAASPRWRAAYIALSAANFLNLYVVLTTLYPNNPGIADWLGIGSTIRSSAGVTAIAVVHLVAFLWVLAQLRPGAREAFAAELEEAAEATDETGTEATGRTGTDGRRAGAAGLAVGAGGHSFPASALAGGPQRSDTSTAFAGNAMATTSDWPRRPSPNEPGLWAEIRRRVLALPVRPDRSRTLDREPGGRLDRLDLWIVVVLVLSALVLRTFRLSEPYSMHFDEVYHARTATEFLQDWRYGEPHTIYEYTHPHLAKYAMAVGIELFGDDRVTAQSSLGVPIRAALVEPRWEVFNGSPGAGVERGGDRLYATTGSEVRVYDLRTRALLGSISLPGASTLALDSTGHRVFVGTDGGEVSTIDTTALVGPTGGVEPISFGSVGAPVTRLLVTSDGTAIVATTSKDEVVTLDPNGKVVGRASVPGVADLAEAGTTEALGARPADVPDPKAAASVLAGLVGGNASTYATKLSSGAEDVIVAGGLASDAHDKVDKAIQDGSLAGFSFRQLPRIAAADRAGIAFLSPTSGAVIDNLAIPGGVKGVAMVTGLDQPKIYVAAGSNLDVITLGDQSKNNTQPSIETVLPMPGPVHAVTLDPSSVLVHVLGEAPGGKGATIYVIEPHANAVFADARLPFEPTTWATDAAPQYPSSDRQQILAFSGDGTAATVDIGRHAFAWRIPGVILGALTAGLLYLMVRILFRRRSIGVLAALLTLADGMLFVQSRIAMNDVYVGFFIVAAYALFAAVWTRAWRWRGAFWVSMPILGVLLGLALASKWVGLYAMAGIALLILGRSALGRLIIILGLIGATTVLGYMAMSVPNGATSNGNLFFMLLMIGLTVLAVVVTVLHPVSWSADEVRFAIGAPAAIGVGLLLVALPLGAIGTKVGLGSLKLSLLQISFGFFVLAALVAVGFRAAAWFGLGPLAPPPAPDDPAALVDPPAPAAEGWLRLGSGFGIPAIWMTGTLIVLPIVVYVISYLPWVALGNRLFDNWPPGHPGQTLVELTKSMYDYHNNLRATHAASSPWWAWPFDLKPVWFYQGSFADGTAASIYDSGNLVVWWLSVPAMAFLAWQAFKRRSLALALVAIGFAMQWLPWVRIDRATFQYHYYTSVPFLVIALAYLLAELWHGASHRTWLLARASAAVAIVGPALLWVSKAPLCGYVRVTAVYPGSQACTGDINEPLVITARSAGLAIVMTVAVIALLYQLLRLDEPGWDVRAGGVGASAGGAGAGGGGVGGGAEGVLTAGGVGTMPLARLGLTALLTAFAVFAVNSFLGETVVLSFASFRTEGLAVLLAIPLLLVAAFVVTARDARRFVVGCVLAAFLAFMVVYPNISALPLPSILVNAYQGLLPTWLWPFQFPVNTDAPVATPSFFSLWPAMIALSLTATCLVVAYSAASWRSALAERRLDADDLERDRFAPKGGRA